MQHYVTDPQGVQHIINAPDDATPEQILEMAPKLIPENQDFLRQLVPDVAQPVSVNEPIQAPIAQPQAQPAAPQDNGFMSRMSQDIDRRKEMGQNAISAYAQGQQDLPETVFQVLGKTGLGTVNDAVGEGLQSGFSALASLAPQGVKSAVGNAANYVANSPVGVAAKEGLTQAGEKYGEFANQNPRAARNLESVGNIVTALPIGAATLPASEAGGSALSKLGTAVTAGADARATANKIKDVQNLITPHITPTVQADQFSRATEKGVLRKRVVEPTQQEKAIIATVSELPVSRHNSLLKNANIIEDAKDAEAEKLMANLRDKDVAIDPTEVNAVLDSSLESLKKSPFITGDAETSAAKVIVGMKEALKNNESTASGLLQARKDFDYWVKSQKGAGIFDPQRDSAVSTAVQHVRQSINDLIEAKVPDAGFKASLQKQSNLYRALDAIETKGGFEAPTMVGRAARKAANLIPVKSALGKGALALGGVSLATQAPVIGAGALALYGTQKALRSPATQKAIGITLDASGKALKRENPLSALARKKKP